MANMSSVPSWRAAIQSLMQEYPSITSKFMTLATVNAANQPRARYVVFRQWHDRNSIVVVSDTRHNKVEHIRHNPAFEVCWYFNDARKQYRISGEAELITKEAKPEQLELRQHVWSDLSDNTRLQYSWPNPEEQFDKDAFEAAVPLPKENNAPDTFAVLLLVPKAVDMLQLGSEMRREQHVLAEDGAWQTTSVNP
eukprot:TRINITY_DN5620_c0_g2_i1.p1 TRINITY_DN5620_c0_g2~~TRINITY_DN5620_c0_g2_i1.p1  ORF type:complete len:195 (+),score=48.48 TRINITY_DN5620_c0_g2_i1:258-842(+)